MIELTVTPSFRLDGKRALVTGGGRGIGLAAASALAEAGAHVTIAARTKAEIEAAAEAIRARGETDAASAAGDERALAVETEGGRFGEIDHHAAMSCTVMPARQSLVGGTREEKQVAIGVLDDERSRRPSAPSSTSERR